MDKLTWQEIASINASFDSGMSVKEAAADLKHSMSTISKYYALYKAVRTVLSETGSHRFSNRREVREQFDVGAQNDARFGGTLDETGE